jgi:hypothetical protein
LCRSNPPLSAAPSADLLQQRALAALHAAAAHLDLQPLKNLIAMVAQVKQLMREQQWEVTPRSN